MNKLIKYEASWCHPCKVLTSNLNKVLTEYEGKLEVEVRDIENSDYVNDLANHGVQAVPTMIIVDESGQVLNKYVGIRNIHELRTILDTATQ